jgi:peptidoglycan/LPS O-acetylase OafA/YrhL
MNLPPRLHSLDVARGVAALCVVLWHWQHFFFENGQLPQTFDRTAQPLYGIFAPFYERGGEVPVVFFFTLSGFVFFWLYAAKVADRSCSAREFALFRFARLYPLHLLMLVVVLVLQLTFVALTSHPFVFGNNDAFHFLLHLSFCSHWGFESGHSFNAPVWSVSLEVGLYAYFFLLAYLRMSDWKHILGFVAVLIGMQQLGFGGRWPVALEAFLVGGLVFHAVSGYLRWSRRSPRTDGLIVLSAVALWVAVAASGAASGLAFGPWQLYSRLLFPLTIAALVLVECSGRVGFGRVKWVGDITYSSYLIHFPLQLLVALVAMSWGLDSSVFYSPWALLLFFAILISLSLATFHYFERPMQSRIRRWAAARQVPVVLPGSAVEQAHACALSRE